MHQFVGSDNGIPQTVAHLAILLLKGFKQLTHIAAVAVVFVRTEFHLLLVAA